MGFVGLLARLEAVGVVVALDDLERMRISAVTSVICERAKRGGETGVPR